MAQKEGAVTGIGSDLIKREESQNPTIKAT